MVFIHTKFSVFHLSGEVFATGFYESYRCQMMYILFADLDPCIHCGS